jgi:hypothetical protein
MAFPKRQQKTHPEIDVEQVVAEQSGESVLVPVQNTHDQSFHRLHFFGSACGNKKRDAGKGLIADYWSSIAAMKGTIGFEEQ